MAVNPEDSGAEFQIRQHDRYGGSIWDRDLERTFHNEMLGALVDTPEGSESSVANLSSTIQPVQPLWIRSRYLAY